MKISLTPKGEQYARSMWSDREQAQAALERIPAHVWAKQPRIELRKVGGEWLAFVDDERLIA